MMDNNTAAIIAVTTEPMDWFEKWNASINTIPFNTKENNPNVAILIGNVNTFKIGFTTAFNNPITTAVNNNAAALSNAKESIK